MADSIDDLFECFDQGDEGEDKQEDEKSSENEEISKSPAEVSPKGIKRENQEAPEIASKKIKEDDVNVDDIKFCRLCANDLCNDMDFSNMSLSSFRKAIEVKL